jgi:hypothetical protein
MNAEQQIAAAVASLRGSDGPAIRRMAARPARQSHQPSIRGQDGQAKRFSAPAGGRGPVRDPWPRRPGIAGKIRRAVDAAAQVAARRSVENAAFSLLAAGAIRVAVELAEPNHPVIVKLFWHL